MKKHTEARLEDAIVDYLSASSGYVYVDYREGEAKGRYDKERALDPVLVLNVIQKTQEKVWERLHGEETGKIVLDHLCKELDTRGVLKVLRQGFKCYGKRRAMTTWSSCGEGILRK